MGLFKKRTDPEDMARLRAEIERMGSRLTAADADKHELREQLRRLDADVKQHANQIAAAPRPEASLEELREQLSKLDRRIDEQLAVAAASPGVDAAAVDTLREHVDELRRRFDVPLTDPPPAPPAVPEAPATSSDLDDMRDELARFADRVEGVESRLVSISKELAHQIDELGTEVDRAGDHDPTVDVVRELRRAQTELAAEQARYQIAFREELSRLADRFRRR